MNEAIGKITFDILVPIPLSAQRLYERGFNQVRGVNYRIRQYSQPRCLQESTRKNNRKSPGQNEFIFPRSFSLLQTLI